MMRLALAVLFAAIFVGSARGSDLPAVRHEFGAYRVLVVLSTWDPQPFTPEAVRETFERVDSFYRRSSYGKLWLSVTQTPWVHAFDGPLPCDLNSLSSGPRAAAADAGYDLNDYNAVVYLHPPTNCPWLGVTVGSQIWLNGTISPRVVAHELGHSLGLGHANTTVCGRGACPVLAYGDPYDTMGQGTGDFSSYAKYTLGWLTNTPEARTDGVFAIDPLEEPSSRPQAFVITTARNQYWLEDRTEPAILESGERVGDPGVLVRVGPSPDIRTVNVPTLANLLLVDPAKRGRPNLQPGDRFVEPGMFSVTLLESGTSGARLRFSWLDHTPPSAPPNLSVRSVVGGLWRVGWSPSKETGSGVAYYRVSVDDRTAQRLAGDTVNLSATLPGVGRGFHTVRVVAVDRAGNRGPVAVRRFRLSR
jgi:hypothetical protein